MPKALKILVIVLGLTVLTLVIAVIVLPLIVDPNQYKDDIVRVVKEKTGRVLKIEGKIGLSIFPSIGLETGRMEFGNAPGFGEQPFARIGDMAIYVALMPLLRKQIVVQGVRLEGLELNLARDRSGRTNWDDLGQPVAKTQKPAPRPEAPGVAAVALPALHVDSVRVRKANVSLRDAQSGASYAVRNLDLKANNVAPGTTMDVALGFDLEIGKPAVRERIELDTRVQFDPERQTLDIPALSLTLGKLRLEASVKGTKIFDAPALSGTIELKNFNARDLLDKLGAAPDTADSAVLTKLSLQSQFDATADKLSLKKLALTLDDSRLTGALSMRDFSRPAYQFNLELDQIDLDRYLPPPAPDAKTKPGTPPPAATPVEIPLGPMRALDANGEIRIQKLKAAGIRSSDVAIRVAAKGGLIRLGPNQAKLYGGEYSGDTTLDVRGEIPALSISESLSQVALLPLLKDALDFEYAEGAANISAKLTASGFEAQQIKETLTGTAGFAVTDGAIRKIDLKKWHRVIQAAIREKSYKNLSELASAPGDSTKFSGLYADTTIKNGVVSNDNLRIESPGLIHVTGKGSANLPRETIDYTVILDTYPILVTGTFAAPKFRLDVSAISKMLAETVIQEKKSEVSEKIREKGEELQKRSVDKLKEKLRLFK